MKKILLAGLLLAAIQSASAQGDFRSFRFGLNASPNIGWLKPDVREFSSEGVRLNFAYGLVTEFGLGNNYSFLTGLNVTTLGGRLSFPDSTNYFIENDKTDTTKRFLLRERSYQIQYVVLPVMLKMKTNEIGYFTYYGQFGFDLGFRTRAMADDIGKYYTASEAENNDNKINEDTGLFRIALNIGAGVEYNIAGKTSLVFGLSFSNGFTNALKKTSDSLIDSNGNPLDQKALAKYVALTAGILF